MLKVDTAMSPTRGQQVAQSPSHAQRILIERQYRSGPNNQQEASSQLAVAKMGSPRQSRSPKQPAALSPSPKAPSEAASSVQASSIFEAGGHGEMIEISPATDTVPALRGIYTDGGGESMRGVLVCLSGAKGGFTGPCRDAEP